MDDYYEPVDAGYSDYNSAADATGISQEVLPDDTTLTHLPDGAYSFGAPSGAEIQVDPYGNAVHYDVYGNVIASTSNGDYVNVPTPTGTDLTSIIATVTSAAQSAIQLIKAWNTVGAPAPRVSAPVRLASGAITTPNRDGTITTRLPSGQTTVGAMPVGVPYVFSDGASVVNVGDGTYQTINPDGSVRTAPLYVPKTGAAAKSGVGALAVIGLGALLLLH